MRTDTAARPRPARWTHQVTGTAQDDSAPWLALRDKPTAEGELLAQLPDGTHLQILRRSARWARVQVTDGPDAGRKGWVHARWLEARSLLAD